MSGLALGSWVCDGAGEKVPKAQEKYYPEEGFLMQAGKAREEQKNDQVFDRNRLQHLPGMANLQLKTNFMIWLQNDKIQFKIPEFRLTFGKKLST